MKYTLERIVLLSATTVLAAGCTTFDSQPTPLPGYSVEVVATDIIRADGVGIDPNGALVVAEEYKGGGIVRIDPATGSFRHVVRDLANPDNIIVLDSGDIYVTEEFIPGRITRVDPLGRVSTFAEGLRKPEGLDIDDEGWIYAVEHWPDGNLLRYDSDGNGEILFEGVVDGEGLRVLDDGSIVIAETSANRLLRVFPDGSGEYVAEGAFVAPDGVGYDRATGRVFVTEDAAPGSLFEVDVETGEATELISGMNKPQTMIFASDGSMFLTEQGENRVLRVRFPEDTEVGQ